MVDAAARTRSVESPREARMAAWLTKLARDLLDGHGQSAETTRVFDGLASWCKEFPLNLASGGSRVVGVGAVAQERRTNMEGGARAWLHPRANVPTPRIRMRSMAHVVNRVARRATWAA